MNKRTCTLIILFVAGVILITQSSSNAAKITDYEYIMKTEYTVWQGMISYISPSRDHLVVSGRKICLVEVVHQGNTFATVIHDENGKQIQLDNLKAGDWIYVFGGGRRDNEIAAKDIYLLAGKLSEGAFRSFIQDKSLRTWKNEGH